MFFNKAKAYQLIFCSILSKILRALYINANQIRFGRDAVFSVLSTCEPDFHNAFLMSKAAAELQNLRIANSSNHEAFGKLFCWVGLGWSGWVLCWPWTLYKFGNFSDKRSINESINHLEISPVSCVRGAAAAVLLLFGFPCNWSRLGCVAGWLINLLPITQS